MNPTLGNVLFGAAAATSMMAERIEARAAAADIPEDQRDKAMAIVAAMSDVAKSATELADEMNRG